ncbi:MAG: hypothetical protein LUE27_03460 [Clostridia bacterium]|nr:hypothetical protein [Clostridia bacterium]
MAIELQPDFETGETLVVKTRTHKNKETGEVTIDCELLGGLYPIAEDTEKNRADFADKAQLQRMAHDLEAYEKALAGSEEISGRQQRFIIEQEKVIMKLKKGVKELISRLSKYEEVSRWKDLENIR